MWNSKNIGRCVYEFSIFSFWNLKLWLFVNMVPISITTQRMFWGFLRWFLIHLLFDDPNASDSLFLLWRFESLIFFLFFQKLLQITVSFSQLSFALWRLCHQCLGVLADKIFEQVRQLFIAEVTNPGGQPEWQQLILCETAGKLIRQSDLAVKTLRRRKEAHLLQ